MTKTDYFQDLIKEELLSHELARCEVIGIRERDVFVEKLGRWLIDKYQKYPALDIVRRLESECPYLSLKFPLNKRMKYLLSKYLRARHEKDKQIETLILKQENLTKEQIDNRFFDDEIKDICRVLRNKYPDLPLNESMKYILRKGSYIEHEEEKMKAKADDELKARIKRMDSYMRGFDKYRKVALQPGYVNSGLWAVAIRDGWEYGN
jgi:hypothetical protein